MIAVLFTALVVCLMTAIVLWAKNKKKKMRQAAETPPIPGIPVAPDANWLFGHMAEMNKNGFAEGQRKVIVESADDDGVTSFWFLNKAAVSVLLGKDVKTVLNASSFREPIGFLKIHNDVFLGPYALTALMGRDWKYYRMVVHRSFTPSALKGSQDAINSVARTLAKSLLDAAKSSPAGKYRAAVLPIMKMATIDVFALSALGVELQCCEKLQPSPIAQAFDYLTDEYSRRLSSPWDPTSRLYWVPTAANRRHAQERARIRSFIADLVAKKRHELLAEDSTKNNDLLTSLLKANAEKGGEMSDNVLADTLMVLLFGGYDTTSITLAYALYLLSVHPAVQEQCVQEIQTVLGNDVSTSLDDPALLPYTRAVILETLRLYPAAPATTRNLEKPLELRPGKVIIPAGTMMYIPIWSIQRDPRNYPQPNEFRPDRWVKRSQDDKWVERFAQDDDDDGSRGVDEDIAAANRDAFCAFSGGARNCVGRVLAMQEAVTCLAFLLRDLKFECLSESYSVEPRLSSFIQKPADDLPMLISAREDGRRE